MPNYIKFVALPVILTALLVFALPTKAEWSPIKQANDGSFYTDTDSLNPPEETTISFVVYADPKYSCRAWLTVFEFHSKPLSRLTETHEATIKYRVDRGKIHRFEGNVRSENATLDDGEVRGTYKISHFLDTPFLTDLMAGSRLIMDFDNNDADETPMRFNLSGSRSALVQLWEACSAAQSSEWTEEKTVSGTGPEWRS